MTPTVTASDIFTALGNFLAIILPTNFPIIRGQINRVAEPAGPDFVMMSPAGRARLSTEATSWDTTNSAPTVVTTASAWRVTIQVDVHGPNGEDNAQLIEQFVRSDFGFATFAGGSKPIQLLGCSDAQQAPFVNGEGQYEYRWVIRVDLEAVISVDVAAQFMTGLTVGMAQADNPALA
jgi:hypothetical protein